MPNEQPAGCLVPFSPLLSLSECETICYLSPALSPLPPKSSLSSRSVANARSSLPISVPTHILTGPSQNYDFYCQQTRILRGSVANTLAVNSYNVQINQHRYRDADTAATEDFMDFGTSPRWHGSFSDIDIKFASPMAEPAFFYPKSGDFNDPSSIRASFLSTNAPHTPSSSAVNLRPGIHQQQAATVNAQARQRQQQPQTTGVRPEQSQRIQAPHPPINALVEEKISQLLKSIRQSSSSAKGDDSQISLPGLRQTQRAKKDKMDEDKRLLDSQECMKLSTKERRQLRKKVCAREFRWRKKGKQ